MPRFLYVMGYGTPRQVLMDRAHGWDDRNSIAVWIEADAEAEALAWGNEVSRRFIEAMYKGREDLEPSDADWFGWIEDPPGKRLARRALRDAPSVRPGEWPDLGREIDEGRR